MQAHSLSSRAASSSDFAPALEVLIVDEDRSVRVACAEIAQGLGFQTQQADSVHAAREILARMQVNLILLDSHLPEGDGPTLMEEVRSTQPETVVVVMTAVATAGSAVGTMLIGAGDYLTKPFTPEQLSTVLRRVSKRYAFAVESRTLRHKLRAGEGMGSLVGKSPAMENLYRILSKVAYTSHPVLILGESGTGKELIARSIHTTGPNSRKPFLPVDCGSLVPTLTESELSGHLKGAFPGANRAKIGLLSSAEHGTVFLDEIGELPLDLQAKLLRALQEKEVRPMGATQSVPISARIVAATNRDLVSMVESGKFRKDLYFRLNVVTLRVPPLRERKSDIPLLAAHVLDRMRRENGMPYTLASEALRLLMDFQWPGNVRELEHAIERACALSSGPVLHVGDFPTQMQDHWMHALKAQDGDADLRYDGSPRVMVDQYGSPKVLPIAQMEKQAILNTIRQLKGDKLMAARLLGIGKTTLYRKLKEYGVAKEE